MDDAYTIQLKEETFSKRTIPVLYVTFNKISSLLDISGVMFDINQITDDIKTDYISVTDFSKFKLGDFFAKLLRGGLEKSFKDLTKTKKAAKLSVVILNQKEESAEKLKKRLEEIDDSSPDSKYNYIFVNSSVEVNTVIDSYLNNKGGTDK
jgi:hypothetical protein